LKQQRYEKNNKHNIALDVYSNKKKNPNVQKKKNSISTTKNILSFALSTLI
jgi:hypothetical protein